MTGWIVGGTSTGGGTAGSGGVGGGSAAGGASTLPIRIDPTLVTGEPAVDPLAIETYDGSDEVTHPAVVFSPDNFGGYPYWMAATPYGGDDASIENPSVWASHDGDTWVVPSGASNPVVAEPASGFYSDTHLVFGPDGLLHMFWRYVDTDGNDYFQFATTADGINWSEPVETYSTSGTHLSPSFEWDGNQWVMWYVEKLDSGVDNLLRRRTVESLTGSWSSPTTCTGITFPAGREAWHAFVARHGGRYFLLIDDAPDDENGPDGSLYFGVSADGLDFEMGTDPVFSNVADWHDGLYRSCLVPALVDDRLIFDVWYSGILGGSTTVASGGAWAIGRTTIAVPPVASVSSLDDLDDVDTTTTPPATGDGLTFDGTNFVPSALADAVGGRWEVIVSGTAPPVAVTNETEDDWLYGWVSD